MRRRVEYYDEDSLGKRLGRFVGALCAIFIITVAVVLTQRLSDESLANVTFAVLGALACGAPTLLLGAGVIYIALRREQERRVSPAANVPTVPAIVVQMPPPITAAPPANPAALGWSGQPQRSFTIVGGEED